MIRPDIGVVHKVNKVRVGFTMAHLSSDSLPDEFDVVVEGTGLIESILAAALARCGKRVLHLDKNSFYGELWASLMHKEMQEWLQNPMEQRDEQELAVTACEDHIISIDHLSNEATNLIQTVHGSEREPLHDSEGGEEFSNTTSDLSPGSSRLSWNYLNSKKRIVYDICPKVLACRGMMVDTLTKSGCSRYVEFKAINKVCVYQSGKVEQVPCSRADVFESKLVSMLEKRKMMKFLAFCSNFENEVDVDELENMTFIEYLKTTDLTENLIQYVWLCIAMTEKNASALEGLQAAKLFVISLGRFDNAPFLYPIFGGGELPQAFCRNCAVFGGVYCLKRSIDALILSDNQVSKIKCSNGQKISCSAVVCNASVMKKAFSIVPNVRISRAMLLVDGPIVNTGGKLTLLNIPPFSTGPSQNFVVRVLQLDSSTNTAVDGTFMVHLMCRSMATTAKQDLEAVARLLYNLQDDTKCNTAGPRVLWSLYFNLDMCNMKQNSTLVNQPSNLYLTSDPHPAITYESAVQEVEEIFKKLCPEKNFLAEQE